MKREDQQAPTPEITATGRHMPLPSPVGHFQALDGVMQRWTDMRGTASVMMSLLDADPDEEALGTMRRHLEADLDAMAAALDVAWESIIRKPDNEGGARVDGV